VDLIALKPKRKVGSMCRTATLWRLSRPRARRRRALPDPNVIIPSDHVAEADQLIAAIDALHERRRGGHEERLEPAALARCDTRPLCLARPRRSMIERGRRCFVVL
jgi:hypothetical protein